MHNLFKNIYAKRIKPDGANWEAAAGFGDTPTSDVIDLHDAEGVAIETVFGPISAGGTAAIQVQYSLDGATNWTNVTGGTAAIVAANADQVAVIEIFNAPARYLRLVTTRATANVTIDAMLVKKYGIAHRTPPADATYPVYTVLNNP